MTHLLSSLSKACLPLLLSTYGIACRGHVQPSNGQKTVVVFRQGRKALSNADVRFRCGDSWHSTHSDEHGRIRLPMRNPSPNCVVKFGGVEAEVRDNHALLPAFALRARVRYKRPFCSGTVVLDERYSGVGTRVCGVKLSIRSGHLYLEDRVWPSLRGRTTRRYDLARGSYAWFAPPARSISDILLEVQSLLRTPSCSSAGLSDAIAEHLKRARAMLSASKKMHSLPPTDVSALAPLQRKIFIHAVSMASKVLDRRGRHCTSARKAAAALRGASAIASRQLLELTVETIDALPERPIHPRRVPGPRDRRSAPLWLDGTVTSMKAILKGPTVVLAGSCAHLSPAQVRAFYALRGQQCPARVAVLAEPGSCVDAASRRGLRVAVLEREGRWALGLRRHDLPTLLLLDRTGRQVRRVRLVGSGIQQKHLRGICQTHPPARPASRPSFLAKLTRFMTRRCWANAEALAVKSLKFSATRSLVRRVLIEALARQGKMLAATRHLRMWRRRHGAAAAAEITLQMKTWMKSWPKRRSTISRPTCDE